MLRQLQTDRSVIFRLNLRPGRARRLSKAGRHWAPITRQRATRKERHSGLTWPTYCNKPNWAPPVIDGLVRTVAYGDRRCKAENGFSSDVFLECDQCHSASAHRLRAKVKRPIAR